jgi:hypothetical protein
MQNRRIWPHDATAAHLIDGPALAIALGMPRGTFRRWAAATGLRRHGTDTNRRALYHLGEALRHAESHGVTCTRLPTREH